MLICTNRSRGGRFVALSTRAARRRATGIPKYPPAPPPVPGCSLSELDPRGQVAPYDTHTNTHHVNEKLLILTAFFGDL